MERWARTQFKGYEVSSQGRVRSWWKSGRGKNFRDEPRILSQRPNYKGYMRVTVNGAERRVACLVLDAFRGPRPKPHYHARHLNGDSSDCRLRHLAWGTPKQNAADKIRHGTY